MVTYGERVIEGICIRCGKIVQDPMNDILCPNEKCVGYVFCIHASDTPEGRNAVSSNIKDMARNKTRRDELRRLYENDTVEEGVIDSVSVDEIS